MKRLLTLVTVTLALIPPLTACNLPIGPPATAETGPQTAAAQTVEAVLTQSGPGIQQTGQALQTPGVAATPTAPSPTPEVIASASTPAADCQNKASFVDDVTIRDNSEIEPGTRFVKIWRLRNSGDCTWTPAYLLTFFGGQRMEAPSTVTLSSQVARGETVDLAVDMQAPEEPGTYQGFWKLRSPEGQFFGIGPQGDQSFWVKIVVPPPPTEAVTASATPSATISPSPPPAASTASSTATASPTTSETSAPTAESTESPTLAATMTPSN